MTHYGFFKLDKPAGQFEATQQKGGNYYCFAYEIHAEVASSYIYRNKLTSICHRMRS